eukprot:6232607-Amphidinium_carterae.1
MANGLAAHVSHSHPSDEVTDEHASGRYRAVSSNALTHILDGGLLTFIEDRMPLTACCATTGWRCQHH